MFYMIDAISSSPSLRYRPLKVDCMELEAKVAHDAWKQGNKDTERFHLTHNVIKDFILTSSNMLLYIR